MKNFLLASVLLVSATANADYFFCRMKVDNDQAEVEADYRVFEAQVSVNGFTCTGKLIQGGIVKVSITADGFQGWAVTGEGKLHGKVQTSTRHPDTNLGTELMCECGLQ